MDSVLAPIAAVGLFTTKEGGSLLLPKPLAWVIIGAVTTIWSASQITAIFVADYTTDPMLHTIFMAIVGGAFALKGRGDGDSGKTHTETKSEVRSG